MNIKNEHFIWSFFMFIFYDYFLWSFISLSLRLPYSVCGRVCVWWGVAGKALILRNKRKYKIRQHKRWQDKTEQGTRRLDRSTHDHNVPCFMSLWCMTKSQEFKGRRLAKATRYEKIRQDKKRQGITRQEKTRHNKTRQDKTTTRQDKTRQDKTRSGKARPGKARQGKARHGKARQGKAS